jgi:hypothetical protein
MKNADEAMRREILSTKRETVPARTASLPFMCSPTSMNMAELPATVRKSGPWASMPTAAGGVGADRVHVAPAALEQVQHEILCCTNNSISDARSA